jgi:hypothetical protein
MSAWDASREAETHPPVVSQGEVEQGGGVGCVFREPVGPLPNLFN